jgi:predicted transcriptional regulator
MNVSTVAIPDSLYHRLKHLAEQQQISVDQFVASAVAEKMAIVENEGYLQQRARRADEMKLREALANIPDTAPEEQAKL